MYLYTVPKKKLVIIWLQNLRKRKGTRTHWSEKSVTIDLSTISTIKWGQQGGNSCSETGKLVLLRYKCIRLATFTIIASQRRRHSLITWNFNDLFLIEQCRIGKLHYVYKNKPKEKKLGSLKISWEKLGVLNNRGSIDGPFEYLGKGSRVNRLSETTNQFHVKEWDPNISLH